jgi:hypothetical protein
LKETACIVANEGRRLIGCDRVSIAIKKGRKCKVQAISGQDTIENRSNIVTALNNLATRVVAAGEPLWHDGATEDLPPQIEEALEDYVDQSYGRNIAVLPLREPERRLGVDNESGAAGEIDRDNAHRGEVIGALIVEQIESDIPEDVFRARCDLVYEHGTRAIANSRAYSNLFLMPLWRTLGRASWVLRARTLPKTIGVVGLLLTVVLGLTFVKKDFNLEAEGTLVPSEKREIFAPIDGEVIAVNFDHDDPVQQNDILIELRNRDIEIQIADIEGQIQTNLAEQAKVQGQLSRRQLLKPSELRSLQAEKNELLTKDTVLQRKLQLQRDRKAELMIRSPIQGRVVSWDVEKNLRMRPIMTGQVLMEVADLEQNLVLEVELPEKREGHLDEYIAQQGLSNLDQLSVTYILATDPDEPMDATLLIDSIAKRADANEEHGAVIKMRVNPDQATLRNLQPRPGAKVIAKIYCGRRSSGFVFFHEIYEWCHKFFF